MNKEQFLDAFKEILQTDENIALNTVLDDLEEWDSLAKMATTSFVDKELNFKLTFSDYEKIQTVQDLMNKIGV